MDPDLKPALNYYLHSLTYFLLIFLLFCDRVSCSSAAFNLCMKLKCALLMGSKVCDSMSHSPHVFSQWSFRHLLGFFPYAEVLSPKWYSKHQRDKGSIISVCTVLAQCTVLARYLAQGLVYKRVDGSVGGVDWPTVYKDHISWQESFLWKQCYIQDE